MLEVANDFYLVVSDNDREPEFETRNQSFAKSVRDVLTRSRRANRMKVIQAVFVHRFSP